MIHSLIGSLQLRARRQDPRHVKDRRLDDLIERDDGKSNRRGQRSAGDHRIECESRQWHKLGEDEGDRIEIEGQHVCNATDKHDFRLSALVDLPVRRRDRGNEFAERLFPAIELHDTDAGGDVRHQFHALIGGLETLQTLLRVAIDADAHEAQHEEKHDDDDERSDPHAHVDIDEDDHDQDGQGDESHVEEDRPQHLDSTEGRKSTRYASLLIRFISSPELVEQRDTEERRRALR